MGLGQSTESRMLNLHFTKASMQTAQGCLKDQGSLWTHLELLAALKSCSDLAPGSDGISYSVYKKLWVITGAVILDAWNYL